MKPKRSSDPGIFTVGFLCLLCLGLAFVSVLEGFVELLFGPFDPPEDGPVTRSRRA